MELTSEQSLPESSTLYLMKLPSMRYLAPQDRQLHTSSHEMSDDRFSLPFLARLSFRDLTQLIKDDPIFRKSRRWQVDLAATLYQPELSVSKQHYSICKAVGFERGGRCGFVFGGLVS